MKRTYVFAAAGMLVSAGIMLLAGAPLPSLAHEGHVHAQFSAGEPGDRKKPARAIKITMREDGGKKFFEPARIEVRRGEQIRFTLQNEGTGPHEFALATAAENRKHADEMKKFPDMEHDEPNAKRVAATKSVDLFWKFSKRGEFQFACLVAGHYDAQMVGTVIVK